MSYKTRIINMADSGNGVSVEAEVNGEVVAHTFPKDMGFFEEPSDGSKPRFVEKLEDKYEQKLKRQSKKSVEDVSTEEAKVHSGHFKNKTYGKSFKGEEKVNQGMKVDLDDPEEVRTYLKENMAEGYLSEEEGMNIDEFVDRYAELMNTKQNLQEIVEQIQTGRVQ